MSKSRVAEKRICSFLSFQELLLGLSALVRGDPREKLEWAFRIYDSDEDGVVSREELLDVLRAVHDLMGDLDNSLQDDSQLEQRADDLLEVRPSQRIMGIPVAILLCEHICACIDYIFMHVITQVCTYLINCIHSTYDFYTVVSTCHVQFRTITTTTITTAAAATITSSPISSVHLMLLL